MSEPVVQLTPFAYQQFWLKVAVICGLAYFALLALELYVFVTLPLLQLAH